MSDGDASLSQALSQLSEAADIVGNDEVEEVARVRKARASISEHARQSGDNAGNLLSSLIGQSNAEIEEEKNKIERAAREKEAQEKAKQEQDAEKQQREAAAASAAKKRKTTTGILAATFIGILAAVAIVIALSIKGPDYYAFKSEQQMKSVAIDRMQGSHLDTKEIAIAEVVQEAPRVATKSNKGSKAKTDVYGIGPAKNVLSGSSIVK